MPSLDPYVWPKSVAIIGASPEPLGIRGRLTATVVEHDFTGETYLVSRSCSEINGRKTYRSVSEIPADIDLALICVPAEYVLQEVKRSAERGVKAVQIVSSGFAEDGTKEGRQRQEMLVQMAHQFGILVVGPNCQGLVNTYNNLFATFSAAYEGKQLRLPKYRREGRIAIASQSGGIGNSCFFHTLLRQIPLSFVVSTGNNAVNETIDLIDVFLDDQATVAVVTFIEDIKDTRTFERVARKALRKGIPIIVNKVGQFESGRRAASAHTGAVPKPYAQFREMFDRHGVIVASDLGEMIDIANGFSCFPSRLPRGRRMAILTPSGGGGGMMADAAELAGLEVAEFDQAMQSRMREVIPDFGAVQNPVDATAQSWMQVGFSKMIERVMDDSRIDGIFLVGAMSTPRGYAFDIEALAQLMPRLSKPALLWSFSPALLDAREQLSSVNIPVYEDIRNTARTMIEMANYRAARERFMSECPPD